MEKIFKIDERPKFNCQIHGLTTDAFGFSYYENNYCTACLIDLLNKFLIPMDKITTEDE